MVWWGGIFDFVFFLLVHPLFFTYACTQNQNLLVFSYGEL